MRWMFILLWLAVLPACTKRHGLSSGNAQDSTYFGRLSFVVQDNYTFSDYYNALVQSGYADTLSTEAGPFTILVPNNDAVAASKFIGQGDGVNYLLRTVDPSLAQYVGYYILPGSHPFARLPLGIHQQLRSLLGTPVYVTKYVSGGDTLVTVNDAAVIAQDLPATNGLIEVIASVPEPQVCTSLWQRMQKDPTLTDFTAAVERAGLASLLSNPDTLLTVLAPGNYAFSQLYTAINHTVSLVNPDSILAADPKVLRSVVLNHVLKGMYFAGDFARADTTQDSVHLTMYGGATVLYKSAAFFSATLAQQYGQYFDDNLGQWVLGYYGPIYPAAANYYAPYTYDQVPISLNDRPTGNGILHVVSTVMLPNP